MNAEKLQILVDAGAITGKERDQLHLLLGGGRPFPARGAWGAMAMSLVGLLLMVVILSLQPLELPDLPVFEGWCATVALLAYASVLLCTDPAFGIFRKALRNPAIVLAGAAFVTAAGILLQVASVALILGGGFMDSMF